MNYYKIILSTKHEVEIDELDYQKFVQNVSSGKFIQLKQALINPSFVITIIPTTPKSKRLVEGYVDEKTGRYVVTKDEKVEGLENAFDLTKQLNR